MIALYQNIKKERILRGMSQEELAHKVGYADKGMISRIENGKVDLPQSKIVEFADVFGVTPAYLMGWEDNFNELNKEITTIKEQFENNPKKTVDTVLFNNNEKIIKISEDVNKALELYKLYEKAEPNIQAAIESLLKGSQ